jgi:Spy/CpxP family protein refolding chaperone
MKYALKSLLVLALMVVVTVPALADDDAPKKKRKPKPAAKAARGGNRQVAAMMKKLKDVELTAEQKEKIKAIGEKFGPKLRETQAAVREAAGGREFARKRAEATKKAREQGLKGKELQAAVLKELDLTPEAQEAMKKAQTAVREVNREFVAAVREVLTPEQLEKAGLRQARAKKGKAAAAKKRKAAAARKGKSKLPGDPQSVNAEKKLN